MFGPKAFEGRHIRIVNLPVDHQFYVYAKGLLDYYMYYKHCVN